MRASTLHRRAMGLPLLSLAVAAIPVAQQYMRRNTYARELRETQAEYRRLSATLPSVPTSASALFAGSYPHQHTASEEGTPHAEPPLPSPASPQTSAEERNLFLTPGGVYTQSDIAANGNMIASQKFAGMTAHHDMHPQVGARLCPITNTRADARFAWVVGGKTYLFCCPPCVQEFVAKAKKQTRPLPAPETFVQH